MTHPHTPREGEYLGVTPSTPRSRRAVTWDPSGVNPRNTSQDDPLVKFLTASLPGGIEAQEAAGQREVVNSDVLPTRLMRATNRGADRSPDSARRAFEAAGFTFGEVVDGDPLFQRVTLPEGWTRQGSDHSMWSDIVDEHGRRRVSVFYKAAFYDRDAHATLTTVYEYAGQLIDDPDAQWVLDAWCTAGQLREALQERAAEYTDWAEKDGPDSEWAAKATRARALIDSLPA